MSIDHASRIAIELNLKLSSVEATLKLLNEQATIPFIARYRKEVTGSLDEVSLAAIQDRSRVLSDLDQRKTVILNSRQERSLLSDTLKSAVNLAKTLVELEDIYLPYKPKRRTRATMAKERGLEPLALYILEHPSHDVQTQVEALVDPSKELTSTALVLAGARDIIAEIVAEHALARSNIRDLYEKEATLQVEVISGKEVEGAKYKDYFKWNEPLKVIPSHRLLAIRRGEKEGFLYMRLTVPEDTSLGLLNPIFISEQGFNASQIELAIKDSLKRLLNPSIETEIRLLSKQKADTAAIEVFAQNLRQLLLGAPLGQKSILGIDPGFRTGCKVVCLDPQGQLLHNDVIYINQSSITEAEAKAKILKLCTSFKIEAIAIGNGTGSRETELFIQRLSLPKTIQIVMVNESGASIYSASAVAREEFPDQDITVRGAVSIARRLMDPLAELVKLDPKSIGVGQYQHDVDQNLLQKSLEATVVSCVNAVGVEINTASKQLLSYVSGLNSTIAQNIVQYRNEHGPFVSRDAFKKVPRLGVKAFEQAAGFLRIRNAINPLDNSAVHPESYALVEHMAHDQKCSVIDLLNRPELRTNIRLELYKTDFVGLPTLQDIMTELTKPGRDPREQFEAFQFADTVHTIEDLTIGMRLPGIVTNVTAFGAFVDIGVHQDGLVHISHLSDEYVATPADIVKVQQKVWVRVTEIDIPRKRIALSMKTTDEKPSRTSRNRESISIPYKPTKGTSAPAQSWNSGWFNDALKKR